MSNEEIRVVLLKPGDVLLIGNAPAAAQTEEAIEAARKFFGELDVQVAMFEDDISISVGDPGTWEPLKARAEESGS